MGFWTTHFKKYARSSNWIISPRYGWKNVWVCHHPGFYPMFFFSVCNQASPRKTQGVGKGTLVLRRRRTLAMGHTQKSYNSAFWFINSCILMAWDCPIYFPITRISYQQLILSLVNYAKNFAQSRHCIDKELFCCLILVHADTDDSIWRVLIATSHTHKR